MNAGFSTLKYLKAHLLAEALRDGTEYNAALTAIGQGVAAQFETFCNRQFYRVEDATAEFTAARDHFVLPRYPVETVDVIELQVTYDEGYVEQDINLIQQVNLASGMIRFAGTLGSEQDLVRVTYTGGYWWNTNETAVDSVPTGATELPDDILIAWLMQCTAAWDKHDKLGLGITQNPDVKQTLGTLQLLDGVKEILTKRIRYAIT